MKKKTVWLVVSCLMVLSLLLASCAPAVTEEEEAAPPPEEEAVTEEEVALSPTPTPPTPTAAPAEFEVISLDIESPEVMTGEIVTITAVVKNIGGSKGTYAVILSVDGVTIETKEVAITSGSSKVVTFSLAKDAPGTYQVNIGGLSSSLTIKEKLISREVELKHDVGKGKDCLSSAGGGYIIDFTPPAIPFTIKKVRMVGVLAGSGWEGEEFSVAIWNKDYQPLHIDTYPVTMFPVKAPAWVEVEIPNIEVTDKFYIHVYTGTERAEGIHISADASIVNEHSDLTVWTAEGVYKIREAWPFSSAHWFGDKSKVNWRIRVVGTIMVSAATPTPTPTKTAAVEINTAHGMEREHQTKAALQMLLAEYDVSKWIFTKSVLVEEGVIPRSHPILTINTRHLNDKLILLSTFIHEQIHWFLSARNVEVNQAIDELRVIYPEVPVGGSEGARDEHSTYLHLIVNYLEFSAMVELVGQESGVSTMERMDHYTWIYQTVLSETDKIEEIVRKYGLIIEQSPH